jgi:DNA-binding LytR/AlgR family response regulator
LKKQQQLPDCMYVKADGRMVKILLDDILFIEGRKQYVQIVMAGRKVLTLDSMKRMEAGLPLDAFARVHKSFIVAINKVTAVGNDALYIGDTIIRVGRSYKHVKMMQ